MDLQQYTIRLFNCIPTVGECNPEGEVSYPGYKPVEALFGPDGYNLEIINFPEVGGDDPDIQVYVAGAVVLDEQNRVLQSWLITVDNSRTEPQHD